MTESDLRSEYPLPAGMDEPTEKAVVMALRLLAQVPNVREMSTSEFLPYFVEAISLSVSEFLFGLNIWLDDPFKPEEVQELVGGVAYAALGGRRLAELSSAEVAKMAMDAIDTYVGKELDKQAKVVIQAHTFMQQVRGG
jgi:hypothetical protein